MRRPIVVAVGGNALLRRGGPADVASERASAAAAARAIARIDAPGGLVVTHGNGPQVGALALGAEATGHRDPMAMLVAESQGRIGHLLQAALEGELAGAPGDRPAGVACVLTHVEVDPADPAFATPTKPIGAVLDRGAAQELAATHHCAVAPDGDGWRRVVASPEPLRVPELATIRTLVGAGGVVVCGGGGGVPVVVSGDGWRDAEAVVDKDLTSALLAVELDAERLVILTDVAAVHTGWGSPAAAPVAEMRSGDLRDGRFEAGTMGPKVEAAHRFADATGRPAHIGALADAAGVAAGRAGTTVSP